MTAEAPPANSDRAIATAAYEHEEEAAPSPVAVATGRQPSPPSARRMRSRGTHACTTAEMANPSTRAHQTAHAISSEFEMPSQIVLTMLVMPLPRLLFAAQYTPRGYMSHAPAGGALTRFELSARQSGLCSLSL